MYCLHCGKEIDADKKFCRYCGSPQNTVTPPGGEPESRQATESFAGAPDRYTQTYMSGGAQGGESQAPAKNSKKTLLIILISASGVVVLAAVVLTLWLTGVFANLFNKNDDTSLRGDRDSRDTVKSDRLNDPYDEDDDLSDSKSTLADRLRDPASPAASEAADPPGTAQRPTLTPPASNPEELYASVIGIYALGVSDDGESLNFAEYAFHDIDSNGVAEMFVRYETPTEYFTTIYTYTDGAVRVLGTFWSRYWIDAIDEQGIIYTGGSNSWASGINETLRISDNKKDLLPMETWEYDYDTGIFTHTSNGVTNRISEREFDNSRPYVYDVADVYWGLYWRFLFERQVERYTPTALDEVILQTYDWIRITADWGNAQTIFERDRNSYVWTMQSRDGGYRMVDPDFWYDADNVFTMGFPTTPTRYYFYSDHTGTFGSDKMTWSFETDPSYSRMSISGAWESYDLWDSLDRYPLVTIHIYWYDGDTSIFYRALNGTWQMKSRTGGFSSVSPSFSVSQNRVVMGFSTTTDRYTLYDDGYGTFGNEEFYWFYNYSSN